MHDAGDGAVGVIADRIGALLGRAGEFGGIGDELPGDRIVRIGRIDQLGHGRRDRDRIARRDGLDRRAAPRARRAPRPRDRRRERSDFAAALMRSAPSGDRRPHDVGDARRAGRQHHQAVDPERDAARLRHLRRARRGNPRRSGRLRHRRAAARPFRPRSGGAARRGRSVRRRHWRARRRRHRARTVRRRADRGPSGGRAPPRRRDIRRGWSGARSRASARPFRRGAC